MGEHAMESVQPLVSVIVPVYAGLQTLPDLLERCKAIRDGKASIPQGLLHELIFVCDEPVDESESFLAKTAPQLDWVRVVSLARNSGQHLATAVGILYSSGDWILTMDEDLQHPPELIAQILTEALRQGLDLLYVKSTIRVHANSIYRDTTSTVSKMCMRIFTRDDYSMISSFRLIRGEVARAIAISVDGKTYLDAVLFSATSSKRRGILYAQFSDQRDVGRSGYSLPKLLRHYGRLIMSAEFSGLRMLTTLGVLIGAPLIVLMLAMLVLGWLKGTQQIAPGWLSLYSLGVSMNILLVVYAVYSLKLLSALFLRSSGCPQFLVISRDLDSTHLAYLLNFELCR
jgi:glycosyltransferase involved in cell wall biosynthesis